MCYSGECLADDIVAKPSDTHIHYLLYGEAGEPLQIEGDDKIGQGLVTDVIREVFRSSGYQVETVVKPLKRIKREMQYGQAKRWIAYGLRSWKAQGEWENATFAEVDIVPYSLSLVFPKTHHPKSFHFSQLSGQQVVWLQGFKYPGAVAFSDKYDFTYLRAASHESAIKMLEAGRAPFFMESAERIRFAMEKLNISLDDYRFVELKQQLAETHITLMMSNDLGDSIHQFVNHRLRELQDSGWLEERARFYGFQDVGCSDSENR
ncbi:hypothetical protein [Pseudomaricurvus sp.]|uniref:hypothetical protein n=1 Tax=Pseudomaricurvus sp. TaxID=2004510 RepID=UPI003F6C9220